MRWGVVLAGGDGVRLRSLTRALFGDDRPKQFCPLVSGQTLLSQTVRRAKSSIPGGQILFAFTRAHREFYLQETSAPASQRIVQPYNKGTAPPIIFSVLSIHQVSEDALIAILPSDHHYADDRHFTAALESGFEIAASHGDSVVLIGAHPDRPEIEYGWIELGAAVQNNRHDLLRVRSFREKPTQEVAQAMLAQPSAWNTFVMVGRARTFLDVIASAVPDTLQALRSLPLWAGDETPIEDSAYEQMPSCDFSRQVLSIVSMRLLVLRVLNLGWTDLGNPGRVMRILKRDDDDLARSAGPAPIRPDAPAHATARRALATTADR